jgi:hypothetical protein
MTNKPLLGQEINQGGRFRGERFPDRQNGNFPAGNSD